MVRRSRRNVRSRRTIRRRGPNVRRQLSARRFAISSKPSPHGWQNWNSCTVGFLSTIADGSHKSFTIKDILQGLLVDLSTTITDTSFVSFRLMDVRVHDVAGRAMALALCDLERASSVKDTAFFTTSVVTYPARNGWASVGARWSNKDQNTVLKVSTASSGIDNPYVFSVLVDSLSDTTLVPLEVLVKVRLLWKFTSISGPNGLAELENPFARMRKFAQTSAPPADRLNPVASTKNRTNST